MKLNFKFLKKGKTVYWIIGGIILFVIAYFLLSRQSAANSSANYSSGVIGPAAPTDAQVQAAAAQNVAQIQANAQVNQTNAQIQALQIQANSDVAQATIAAGVANNQTQSASDLAALAAQVQTAGINAQLQIAQNNNETNLATSKVAAETQIGINAQNVGLASTQLHTNEQMFNAQLTTQAQEFTQQLTASTAQALISQLPALSSTKNTAAVKAATGNVLIPALSQYLNNGNTGGGASVSTYH